MASKPILLMLGLLFLWLVAAGCSSSPYSQAQGATNQNRSPMARRIQAIRQRPQKQGQ